MKRKGTRTQYGFDEDGRPRTDLPDNFFKEFKWEPIEELEDNKLFRMHCMRTRDIAETIMARFPNCMIPAETVGVWFSPSARNGIPGVHRQNKGKKQEIWVRTEIVDQIIKRFERPPFIWEAPEKDAPTIEVKPVPENSIILQRMGGMHGNIAQLFKAVQETKEMIREANMRIDEVNKNVVLTAKWLREQFPGEYTVKTEEDQ